MSDTMPYEGETIPISDVESALECDVKTYRVLRI